MKIEKTIYTCDRCGEEVDDNFFRLGQGMFRKTISALEFEVERYAFLNETELAEKLAPILPDADGIIVLEGVCGYRASSIHRMHLCKKCSKAFRSFMRMGAKKE